MQETLDRLRSAALGRLQDARSAQDLRAIERDFLGKQGEVSKILTAIPGLAPDLRSSVGKEANVLKRELQQALAARAAELEAALVAAARAGVSFDPTLPPARVERGSLHPITQVRRAVEDIFTSMGYFVLDGPEVELDYYNFQALNIPPDHPSRELQDTFYCDREGKLVMRTQTSPVQIRGLERYGAPLRMIAPGRVFRNEQQDATHEHTFHQVEGLVVDRGIHVGHLIGTLKSFLRQFVRRGSVERVRLRPGHFPFVEPGFEFDLGCPFCETGCRVCKGTTWIEFCGCGMVHPEVLAAGRVDPREMSGFAFGFGLDRLVMMAYGIDDIRQFLAGDLRFLEQF